MLPAGHALVRTTQFLTPCLPASLIIASSSWDSKGQPLAARDEGGESFRFVRAESRYNRIFMSNMICRLEKKSIPCSMLGRFVRVRPKRMRASESDFVNHASLKFRLGLSQGVFEGRRCGVPT